MLYCINLGLPFNVLNPITPLVEDLIHRDKSNLSFRSPSFFAHLHKTSLQFFATGIASPFILNNLIGASLSSPPPSLSTSSPTLSSSSSFHMASIPIKFPFRESSKNEIFQRAAPNCNCSGVIRPTPVNVLEGVNKSFQPIVHVSSLHRSVDRQSSLACLRMKAQEHMKAQEYTEANGFTALHQFNC